MPLTKEGFKRKTYIEFWEEMQAQARELMGADINLSDRSPLGQLLMLWAYGRAQDDELAEKVWLSGHVDDAEGVDLDYNAKRIGVSRIQAQKARGQAFFEVEPGASVLSGMIVSTEDGIEFVTTSSGFGVNGAATVDIEAIEPGIAGNVPAHTITEINTPVAGISGVTNPVATDYGANTESDSEFRERYYRSLANAGGASVASIEAALLELPGVIDASVDENDQDYINRGLPPNCIAPFIHGGDDIEIANAIFSRKTGGIRSFGTTSVTLTDSRGKQHTIGFSRPAVVSVWVRLTISKSPDFQQYPVDGDARIRTKIVEHIGGLDADGTRYDGQGLNADVVHYKLIAAIAAIPGINDVEIHLSTDGTTFHQNNIKINNVSIAQTDFEKVVIQ